MILPETIYRTEKVLKVAGTIHFNKPQSLGFDFDLPAQEDFKISVWNDPGDTNLQVWLLHEKKYELKIIEQAVLDSPFYESFSLTIPRSQIEEHCKLITDFNHAIYFYSPLDKYGEFSNFSDFGFEHEDVYYRTVEHFYQSQKFLDKGYSELIIKAKTPKEASNLGKSRDKSLRTDWEKIKTETMTLAVRKKFVTHAHLKDLLLSTDDNLIIENSPYDNFWGIGQTGEGLNQLGTTLMRVRQFIRTAT